MAGSGGVAMRWIKYYLSRPRFLFRKYILRPKTILWKTLMNTPLRPDIEDVCNELDRIKRPMGVEEDL